MQTTLTLRSEIEKGIAELGMNFSSFGELSGINRGIFSAILNGSPPKPISLNQMEAITRAFGKEPGWMFNLYIEECFYDGKPNRRRVEPFLIRCAELGRTDCIREVLSRLLEDLKHVSMIFEIAEVLFTSGKVQESLVFYECVVENEKYNHAERLAISHYRIFRAALGEDNEQNLRAAMRFEPFCGKLPDHHRLDALLKLANVYILLERWAEADIYSEELLNFVQAVYEIEKKRLHKEKSHSPLPTEKPFIFYYGQGFILKEAVLEHQGRYEEARKCIEGYEDLRNFEILDQKSLKEIEKFNLYAKANKINLEILSGNASVLEEYAKLLEVHTAERLPGLLTIFQSANKYRFNIDAIIQKFDTFLKEEILESTHYNKNSDLNRFARIFFELANYYLYKKEYSRGIEYSLQCLRVTVKINNTNMFMKCVPLFEEFRSMTTQQQRTAYEKIIRSVYQNV
ncbi:DNA-binding protein [Saccharibacillus sp. O16]|nr:DNA-binding protein [Saccharibacillus sp. O16]